MKVKSQSEVAQLCLTLCDPLVGGAYLAPLPMGFSRQKYWSGVPLPSPPKCSTWVQSQKRMISVCFQGKPFSITVIQVYAPTSKAEETEVD